MQIWIHDNKMKKITALNNDVPDMLSYTNSAWHSYLDQATSTFDFTIPKFSNGELHEDLKLINDECFVSFYVNGSYQVFYIATLQEDDFNIQLTCNNTNLEYALEYANPFNSSSAQSIQWYLEHMDLLSFAAVEIGNNEISDRKRTLTFDSQETKMNRLQSLMSKFEAEFEFKVELNRDGTYKRIVINIYQKNHIGTDRKDVVLYYSNGLKGVQVSSDKTQMFNAGVFTGKDGLSLNDVEISEKNADGIEEFYSRKGNPCLYAPIAMNRYPATMRAEGQDNWIRKDFTTEYENVNDLKAYALRTLKQYAYPLVTYTASVQSGFVSHYTDLKLGDTIRIIDKNFVGGLALEARVSEMIISFDNPANNSFVFTNYRKLDNKPSSALQTRIEQAVESKLPYRIELATTGGVTFKNNEGETIIKPSLYKGNLPWTKDVTWRWALDGVVTVGMQYLARAENIDGTAVLTVSAYVGNNEVATTEITLTDVNDGDDGVGVESIDRHFTSSDQSDGVTIEGTEWSDKPPAPTGDGKYLWAYDKITYSDGTVTTTKPAAVGANFDVDAFRAEIAEDLKDVPNREEFENKIAEELATSKAEIETQIESAKTQAESNAKEYADTINQETAEVAELANAAADEIKADLVNVKNNLTDTSLVANNAQAAVDAAKRELTEVASDLNTAKQDLANSVTAVNTKVDNTKAELTQAKQQLTTVADDLSKAKTDLQNAVSAVDTKATNLKSDLFQAKQDLTSQAQQLQAQANAQSELTKRVSSVEKTANGTKTTVSELSKTVAKNGKDITSVTARTKVVEDGLAGTKTTLSQVKTTADSTSQKTATLETGLNGLSAKFNSLKIGSVNLLHNSKGPFQPKGSEIDNYVTYSNTWINMENGKEYTLSAKGSAPFSNIHTPDKEKNEICLLLVKHDENINVDRIISSSTTGTDGTKFTWNDPTGKYYLRVNTYKIDNSNYVEEVQIEEGNLRSTYSQNEADIESKVAEYKQTADQNYASLSSTVQTLDGQVQSNKTTAEQTAQGFKTRIESLETYKDGESERANAYFESAKTETAKQLTAERTAIANNYVAKSTYTSDVTGIRNELSATTSTANTTKTNLANYQASNDKMVASLKSSLQTTDGNVSNLQTKVEAVPGQITSAVSAVESKIPTTVGGRNYIRNYGLTATGWTALKPAWKFEIISDSTAKSGQYLKATCTTASAGLGGFFKNLFDFSDGRFFEKQMTWSMDVKTSKNAKLRIGCEWGNALSDVNVTENWQRFSKTFKVATSSSQKAWVFYSSNWNVGDIVYIRDVQLEDGSIATSPVPAIEDTESDITKLSSELTQTKDGITLLATKTELNTAKNELQSGINTATNKANSAQSTANNNAQTISTHTNQISALNTGLQAKVSQTDFNTLSGRVTTAENNITAKANELSSKITSVEGKIPTEIGAVNLLKNSKSFTGSNITGSGAVLSETYQGCAVRYFKNTNPSSNYQDIANYLNCVVPSSEDEYTASFWAKGSGTVSVFFYEGLPVDSFVSSQGVTGNWGDGRALFTLSENWQRYWIKYKLQATTGQQTVAKNLLFRHDNNSVEDETYLAGVQLEEGNVVSGYEPAPEDTATQISNLSSEIKQTADGMTLLATKTELNTAKTELQSGISTATNKANNAQSTANSNAQTISTHTTQISALNTGLSAKVSQSDFNTLSGRVTTAENNITAKANELSSKITSVEGKIPSGEMNLVEYGRPADGYSPYNNAQYVTHSFYYNGAYKMYILRNTNTRKIFLNLNRFKIERNTDYTLYFKGFNNALLDTAEVYFLKRKKGSTSDYDEPQRLLKRKLSAGAAEEIIVTFNTGEYDEGYIRIDNNGTSTAGSNADLYFGDISVKKGKSNNGWSPSLAELASSQDLKNAQSEIKQTTDAIKASVSSVQTAASNAQSTANTAVSKADAAQAGVNTLDSTTVKSASLTINADGIVMKAGKSTTDVANAIGSYFAVNQNAINLFSDKINVKGNMIVDGAITSDKIASKSIKTAHLNGKIITADVISSNAVTADAIKAGAVTTDKMSANSINGDRIAAGTLDAAKIKAGSITASQIASGTITSNQIKAGGISSANIAAGAITTDKIAAGAIDANKIAANAISSDKIVSSGITANVIKGGTLQSLNGSTNFELDTGKLFYNNNNTGVFRIQNGASTMGLKFSNTSLTVNGTSRILSRAILGGDRRETTLDDGKWDKGGFSGIVIETIKGVEPTDNEQADALRVIADNIYFTHTYSNDSLSARGWKMETYSPNTSYPSNVVLKPYGINYRNSNIVVGDLRLDNGDGSGYWMRATINVLKACFGHIINGGTSSQALNAIRSELNKISGT